MSPEDAAARGIEDGVAVRVFNDRGSFSCAARVSDDARPGVLVAPMGWWNDDYPDRRSGQATTSQLLTTVGQRAHLQRQPRRASADQPVVLLRQQDAADRLVEPAARDAAALHRAQHRDVRGLLVAGAAGDVERVRSRPQRQHGRVGNRVERRDPGSARSSVIATPLKRISRRSTVVSTARDSEAGTVKSLNG